MDYRTDEIKAEKPLCWHFIFSFYYFIFAAMLKFFSGRYTASFICYLIYCGLIYPFTSNLYHIDKDQWTLFAMKHWTNGFYGHIVN